MPQRLPVIYGAGARLLGLGIHHPSLRISKMPQIKANGLSFEYDTFGKAGDPAVLFIMGFAAQMTAWPEALMKSIAGEGFHVIRFDNRDIGKSQYLDHLGVPDVMAAMGSLMTGIPFTGAPYTLNDMAKDAAELLGALNIRDAHIVGASMGGMIAQLVAINHPGVTRSMTSIMSTTGNPAMPQATPEAMTALITPPADTSRETRIAHGMKMIRAIGSPGNLAATEEELKVTVTAAVDRAPYHPEGISRQLCAILASPPRNAMLKNLRMPAMVLHGMDDPLVRVEAGRDTAASIPGCRLVEVPGMGHDFSNALVPIYHKHLSAFLKDAESRAKAA